MFGLFKRQKWISVKSFKIDRSGNGVKYVYHIHCFESDKGNRRVEFVIDGKQYTPNAEKSESPWILTTDLYQMQIYRWLNGRRDPEIPTYEQIGEDDTANFLKGKVS